MEPFENGLGEPVELQEDTEEVIETPDATMPRPRKVK